MDPSDNINPDQSSLSPEMVGGSLADPKRENKPSISNQNCQYIETRTVGI